MPGTVLSTVGNIGANETLLASKGAAVEEGQ